MYLSGCLHGLVPLWGEGMGDRLPNSVSGVSASGLPHALVVSTSGNLSEPSDIVWLNSSRSGVISETGAGATSLSRVAFVLPTDLDQRSGQNPGWYLTLGIDPSSPWTMGFWIQVSHQDHAQGDANLEIVRWFLNQEWALILVEVCLLWPSIGSEELVGPRSRY